MMAYGIGVLPLIRKIQDPYPRVNQPYYADDSGAGSNFESILAHFWDLQVREPSRGYFLEPTKSVLVVALRNLARADALFSGMGMTVVTGIRHLGGFIGDREAEDIWLAKEV